MWPKPVEEVAADLGITGTTLTKACTGRNIRKPPRRYWARVRAGQKVKRPPLPISEKPVHAKTSGPPTFVSLPVVRVASYPQVVQRTERAYGQAEVDPWGRLVVPWSAPRDTLDLMVSLEALPRGTLGHDTPDQSRSATGMTLGARDRPTVLKVGDEESRLQVKEEVRVQEGGCPYGPLVEPGIPLPDRRRGARGG